MNPGFQPSAVSIQPVAVPNLRRNCTGTCAPFIAPERSEGSAVVFAFVFLSVNPARNPLAGIASH
jgi:hypothetical protein